MKLLVTGASGYIGARLVPRLAARHSVFTLLRPGASLVAGTNVVPVWGDLRQLPPDLPDRIDGVVHLAQSRSYRQFPEAALDMLDVNVNAAVRLIDYARQAGAHRFCLVSSGSVYEPYTYPLTENAPLAPLGFNGASKLAAEQLLVPYRTLMPIFVPRLFFPYGPGQTDRLIPDLAQRILNGTPIHVDAEGGGPWIAPLHVDDAVQILEAGIEGGWNETVNVAGPEAVPLRRVAEIIGRILGHRPFFEEIERPPVHMVPILDRLRQIYPVDDMFGVEAGLRHMLEAS